MPDEWLDQADWEALLDVQAEALAAHEAGECSGDCLFCSIGEESKINESRS